MPSLDRERALEGGAPIELYWFAQGSRGYYYTNCVDDVIFNNQTYKAAPIKRAETRIEARASEDRITIEVSEDLEIARLFVPTPPTFPLWVTIYRYHEGENDFFYFWRGRVSAAERRDYICTFECENILASTRKKGLRRKFGIQCNHMLYDPRCGVSEAAYQFDTTIVGINRRIVTVASTNNAPTDYYLAGRMRLARTGDVRFIVQHNNNDLRLNASFSDARPGDVVSLFAGCDHTFTTCVTKFNNGINYGGFPYIPTKNPFERIT